MQAATDRERIGAAYAPPAALSPPRSKADDIWVLDLTRGTRIKLSLGGSEDETPAWSPTGDGSPGPPTVTHSA
jgi:hypothetical protein